jgi:hypothetical protein
MAVVPIAAVVLGVLIAAIGPADLPMLIVATGTATVLPILVAKTRRRLDVFEPLVPASAAFALLFVARPIVDVLYGSPLYADTRSATFSLAMVAALAAIVGFNAGYDAGLGLRLARHLPAPSFRANDSVLLVGSVSLAGAAFAALIFIAVQSGGLGALFAQRGALGTGQTGEVPAIVYGATALATPALLLLWTVEGRARWIARVLSLAPLAVILIATIPRGDRRTLIPVLVAAIAMYYLARDTRPSKRTVVVSLFVVFFVLVVPLRDARNGGLSYWDAMTQSISDPGSAVERLLRTGDTEMIDTLALEVGQVGVDPRMPWQYGMATLSETILQPIPRQIWPDKPQPIRNLIIDANWGMTDGGCVSLCPTFSVVGTLYADVGIMSVFLGTLSLGVLFRAAYAYFMHWRHSRFAQAAYAGTLFLPFFVWWSSLSSVVIYAGFYLVPILLITRLARSQGSWLGAPSLASSTPLSREAAVRPWVD